MDITSTKIMRKLEVILLLLLLVFFLSPISSTKASSIPFLLTDPEQGSDDGLAKVDGITQLDQSGEMEGESTDWNNMMGMELEQCSDEVDECLKRRMTSEAHLDYIYTQHQKP